MSRPLASVAAIAPPLVEPAHQETIADLYREHHDFVWRNARRLGADDSEAEDAVHEVFMVLARRPELPTGAGVRAWLFAVTRGIVRNVLRSRARTERKHRALAAVSQPSVGPEQLRADAARELRELLQLLDSDKQAAFIMVELEGMTSAEVAHALRIPRGTVDSRVRTARLELAKHLQRRRGHTP